MAARCFHNGQQRFIGQAKWLLEYLLIYHNLFSAKILQDEDKPDKGLMKHFFDDLNLQALHIINFCWKSL